MGFSGEYVPRDYEDLYCRYVQGSRSLAGTLVRRFTPWETQETQEELTHDVFVRMMEKDVLKIFDPVKANFGGVVYFVVRTVCIGYLKKRMRDPLGVGRGPTIVEEKEEEGWVPGEIELSKLKVARAGQEERIYEGEQLKRLQQELDRNQKGKRKEFRRRCMKEVLARVVEGETTDEIAKVLGVTEATVKNWVGLLEEILEGRYGGG